MTNRTVAELLYLPDSEALRFLPEGPMDLSNGRFSWVAIQHGADSNTGSLNIFDVTSGTNSTYGLHGRPGFAIPTTDSRKYLIGCERELGIFDIQENSWEKRVEGVDADVENTIINDGAIFADNIVFGTKDLEFATPKASLYLYRDQDRSLNQLTGGQICSNGKDIISTSGGGLALIDIDSPTRRVVRYRLDMENAKVTDAELVVDLEDVPGVPDGMVLTPDEQSMIISFYNPNPAPEGQTRQYSLINGSLEHIWETPGSPQNTCPLLLHHEDKIRLVITTAVEHMSDDRRGEAPNAGGIFIAETNFVSPPTSSAFPLEV